MIIWNAIQWKIMDLTKAHPIHNSRRNATTTDKMKRYLIDTPRIFRMTIAQLVNKVLFTGFSKPKNSLPRSSFQVNIWYFSKPSFGSINMFEMIFKQFWILVSCVFQFDRNGLTCNRSKMIWIQFERSSELSIVVTKIVIQMFIVELWIVNCALLNRNGDNIQMVLIMNSYQIQSTCVLH